jgi:hypothetical protein
MQNNGLRPALDEFVREVKPGMTILRKITLSHDHALEVAEILHREDVSRASFMPTLDNVSLDVQQRWLQRL